MILKRIDVFAIWQHGAELNLNYVGLQEVKRFVRVLTTPINVLKATGPKVRRRAFKLANSNK